MLLVLAACCAGSALAVQTVTPVQDAAGTGFAANGPNSWAASRSAGQTLVFYGRYSSDYANESGLGLAIEYDETKFSNVTVDQVMNKCLIAPPQLQNISVGASRAVLGWADISVRRTAGVPNGAVGWTGTADPAAPTSATTPTDGCLDVATFGVAGPQITAAVTLPAKLFRFTTTLAAGFTGGASSIVLRGTSASSAICVPVPATPCFADQTLVVTAVPPSSNADLSSLNISSGILAPPFASGTLSYTAGVVSNSNTITVTPTVADATATVKVNGVTVASGSPSGPITLSLGSNPISVVVTAQDGSTTKPYSVTVSYLLPASCTYALVPSDLANVAASGGARSIVVTTPNGCPVGVTSYQPWVTLNSITPSGGTTTVQLQIGANTGPARATSIVLAGRLFLVTQVAGP